MCAEAERNPGACSGVTLLEMLVALVIAAAVTFGVIHLFTLHSRAYHDQQQMLSLQQEINFALSAIVRDVRMAGYGLPVNRSQLPLWMPGWTDNPRIIDGSGGASDELWIAGALHGASAQLAASAPTGAVQLVLESGQGAMFSTNANRVVFVGRSEVARVIGVSGDTLTISTDPVVSTQGLLWAYAPSSTVERVVTVRYSLHSITNAFPNQSFLVRESPATAAAPNWQDMVAGHIENFQVSNASEAVSMRIQGVTGEPLRAGRAVGSGDMFGRLAVVTEAVPRNSSVLILRGMSNP